MRIIKTLHITLLLVLPMLLFSQADSTTRHLDLEMDFRFRAEQDWNSITSSGNPKEDRTRLRYRIRAGASYKKDWYKLGFRIRTGQSDKQQDPQLTLGDKNSSFTTLPIGLDLGYFEAQFKHFSFWLGKNAFPFKKNNELFWSDNVNPDGVAVKKEFRFKSSFFDALTINTGHFIFSHAGSSLSRDSYLQGLQLHAEAMDGSLNIFPSFYFFRNVPDFPDGNETTFFNYSILHTGVSFSFGQGNKFHLDVDFYNNLENYATQKLLDNKLENEKTAWVAGLRYGNLNKKKQWLFKLTYANIQQYAIVNFLAQNDWARWDYSNVGSPDGRLSNFHGTEFVIGYAINDDINLILKHYYVQQLVKLGASKEQNSRIRIDINVSF